MIFKEHVMFNFWMFADFQIRRVMQLLEGIRKSGRGADVWARKALQGSQGRNVNGGNSIAPPPNQPINPPQNQPLDRPINSPQSQSIQSFQNQDQLSGVIGPTQSYNQLSNPSSNQNQPPVNNQINPPERRLRAERRSRTRVHRVGVSPDGTYTFPVEPNAPPFRLGRANDSGTRQDDEKKCSLTTNDGWKYYLDTDGEAFRIDAITGLSVPMYGRHRSSAVTVYYDYQDAKYTKLYGNHGGQWMYTNNWHGLERPIIPPNEIISKYLFYERLGERQEVTFGRMQLTKCLPGYNTYDIWAARDVPYCRWLNSPISSDRIRINFDSEYMFRNCQNKIISPLRIIREDTHPLYCGWKLGHDRITMNASETDKDYAVIRRGRKTMVSGVGYYMYPVEYDSWNRSHTILPPFYRMTREDWRNYKHEQRLIKDFGELQYTMRKIPSMYHKFISLPADEWRRADEWGRKEAARKELERELRERKQRNYRNRNRGSGFNGRNNYNNYRGNNNYRGRNNYDRRRRGNNNNNNYGRGGNRGNNGRNNNNNYGRGVVGNRGGIRGGNRGNNNNRDDRKENENGNGRNRGGN